MDSMRYPIEEEKFIDMYIQRIKSNNKEDVEFAQQLVLLINEAYLIGYQDGQRVRKIS